MNVDRASRLEIVSFIIFHQQEKQVIGIQFGQSFRNPILLHLTHDFTSANGKVALSANIKTFHDLVKSIVLKFYDQIFQLLVQRKVSGQHMDFQWFR